MKRLHSPRLSDTCHRFTMVEIVLALGVIAIGMVAILGLFPIGANSSRDAIAETYAAEIAQQLMQYTEAQFRSNWTTALTAVGNSKPADAAYAAGTRVDHTQGCIYSTTAGKYHIIRFVNSDDSQDIGDNQATLTPSDTLDFEAMVLVWRNDVSLPTATGTATVPTTHAVRLNVEVSWPAQIPEAQRQTALYTMELFNR